MLIEVADQAPGRAGDVSARRGIHSPPLGGAARVRAMSLLAAHDPATAEHSRETAAMARAVGSRLGFEPRALAELEGAALLHDVGKLLVPPQTLNRPGPLGPRDWELIERHPDFGARLLGGLMDLEGVARIVLEHHERPDGRGYPYGLAAPAICAGAGVVAACDAFEAMTSERPYCTAMSTQEAIDELERGAGTQFDPASVEAVIEVVAGVPACVAG
ncbi:MAG: HD domain-containing protein [Thermoleophilaceae bacterium]|nr:HD domain-containing protein [Thermoleophilaceae bacterium]